MEYLLLKGGSYKIMDISKYLTYLVFIILSLESFSQSYTISGFVSDSATNENLIGATVFIEELNSGTVTNNYGFYSLTLKKGNYNIVFSFLGFKDKKNVIQLDKNQDLNIYLTEYSVEKEEIIIRAETQDKNIRASEMSSIKLPIETIKQLPVVFSETDIMKTIQLLPGVQSAGEGNAGFYVRGGGPDQNLILLDEANVYNATHLMGFFSVFNADAIKDIKLIKGGMPAKYGGRLSSVLDISMKEGNMKKYEVDGGLGVISSRLTIQGPIKNEKSSFIISGRRTYLDLLVEPFIPKDNEYKGNNYYFYDLNTKLNYRISNKDRLFLSGYFGRDVFSYSNPETDFTINIPWGNATSSLRWNHLFTEKLFMNTSAVFSDYKFQLNVTDDGYKLDLYSGIRDYNLKTDFSWFPNIRHKVKFGGEYTYHIFVPGALNAVSDSVFEIDDILKQYAHDASLYLSDEFDINEKIRINAGLRFTYFQQVGPFNRYIKNEEGETTDTIKYTNGENVARYSHLEPRLSFRFITSKTSSVKVSFTQNYQYIHLASMSSVSMPTDLWVPSSDLVKPQSGTQYSLGFFKNYMKNNLETSVEIYYKSFDNQVEYKDATSSITFIGDNADNNFTFGTGESYGIEFFVRKPYGKFTGWIGYTLSKTTRTFPEILNGKTFPAKYDRRHDLSVVSTYQLNEKWSVSAIFVYATGNTATLPVGRYLDVLSGKIVDIWGERNSYRMEAYHRLDISAKYIHKKTKKWESVWDFSIYNVYNHYNPYFIYFNLEGDIESGDFEATARQVSLFPIIPSVSWSFKF